MYAQIIDRDRFWAELVRLCDDLNHWIDWNWDIMGVIYISVGIWLIVIAVCTHDETTRSL